MFIKFFQVSFFNFQRYFAVQLKNNRSPRKSIIYNNFNQNRTSTSNYHLQLLLLLLLNLQSVTDIKTGFVLKFWLDQTLIFILFSYFWYQCAYLVSFACTYSKTTSELTYSKHGLKEERVSDEILLLQIFILHVLKICSKLGSL